MGLFADLCVAWVCFFVPLGIFVGHLGVLWGPMERVWVPCCLDSFGVVWGPLQVSGGSPRDRLGGSWVFVLMPLWVAGALECPHEVIKEGSRKATWLKYMWSS